VTSDRGAGARFGGSPCALPRRAERGANGLLFSLFAEGYMLTIEENAVVKLIGGPANGFLAVMPRTPVPSTSTRASCGPNTDSPRNRAVSQPRNRSSEPIQKQGAGLAPRDPWRGPRPDIFSGRRSAAGPFVAHSTVGGR
jgi:hypothetical protein